MLPKILPWVPLPAPGAPNRRIVRYFIIVACSFTSVSLCPLALHLNFLYFHERHDMVLGGLPFLHLQCDVVSRRTADAVDDISSAHSLESQHGVTLGFGPRNGKKAGQLRLKKAPVESELAARKYFRRRRAGGLHRGVGGSHRFRRGSGLLGRKGGGGIIL